MLSVHGLSRKFFMHLNGITKSARLVVTYVRWHTNTYTGVGDKPLITMDIVFKAKHWQIVVGYFLLNLIIWLVDIIDQTAGLFLQIAGVVIYFGWILLLGYGLAKRQNKLDSTGFRIFVITGILLSIVNSLSPQLKVIQGIHSGATSTLIFVVLAVYMLISLSIIYSYPVKTLKQLETDSEIDINDYFGDIFLFIFFPIGIWTIQPRLNRLADSKTD